MPLAELRDRLTSFLSELSRRRVGRVAAAYAVVGWLAIEFATDVVPILPFVTLPDWVPTVMVGLVVLGFPIAVGFTWLYDLTPRGVERTAAAPDEDAQEEERPSRLQLAGAAGYMVLALLFVGLGARVLWEQHGPGASDLPEIRSLAILPLRIPAVDVQAEEGFADLIREGLTTELGRISALAVKGHLSAMRYAESDRTVREIARELEVDALLSGSVGIVDDEVRMTLHLIHGPTDIQLWSESYEVPLRDVRTLQGEVARTIARDLQITPTPAEEAQLAAERPVDPRAYRAWSRASSLARRLNPESYQRAMAAYREAIAIDPGYAEAYAAMAVTYVMRGSWHGAQEPKEILPEARALVDRALALDSTVAEAHIALGLIRYQFEWNWNGADRAFKRGLELVPMVDYRVAYANFLTAMGRFDEAIEIGRRTLELDPLSPLRYNELAFSLDFAGRDEEALDLYQESLELDPAFPQTHLVAALLYVSRGEFENALAHMEEIDRGGAQRPLRQLGYDGYVYAASGRPEKARKILSRLLKRREAEYVPASAVADVYLGLGNRAEVLRWLEAAYEERDPNLVWLKVAPWYDSLRSDPHFQDLVLRMSFPGASLRVGRFELVNIRGNSFRMRKHSELWQALHGDPEPKEAETS